MGCGGRCFEWSKLLRSFLRLRLPKRQAREEQAFSSKSFFFPAYFSTSCVVKIQPIHPLPPLEKLHMTFTSQRAMETGKERMWHREQKNKSFRAILASRKHLVRSYVAMLDGCSNKSSSLACFGRVHFRSACFLDHLIWNHQRESNTYSMELLQDWWAANTCSCKEIGTKRGTPTPPS